MAQFPESAAEIMPGIRRCMLRKFPYSLIYSIETLILAVAHHATGLVIGSEASARPRQNREGAHAQTSHSNAGSIPPPEGATLGG